MNSLHIDWHPGGASHPLPSCQKQTVAQVPEALDLPFSTSLQGKGSILGRPRRLASPKTTSSGKEGLGG